MARTAEVKRDARIGEAEARCEAQIKEAIAEEQRMAARFLNDTEIAKAQRDFELKKAAYDVEVQTKKVHIYDSFGNVVPGYRNAFQDNCFTAWSVDSQFSVCLSFYQTGYLR